MSQTINQEFIDGLITVIMDAENAGCITSEMVAQVFDHLNKGYKILAPLPSALTALEQSVQAVSSTTAQNKLALDAILGKDTGSAIENLKEVIDFLEGVSHDEKLTAKLQEFRNELNTAKTEITQLTKQGNGIIVFAGFVENASVSTGKSEASSNSAAYDVVFDRTGKRFLLRFERLTAGGIGDGGTIRPDGTVLPDLQGSITGPAQASGLTQYWADWADRDKFALNAGRVYICTSDSTLHIFNGATITAITVAHLEDAAAKTSETLTDHEQRIVFTELGLGAAQEQCRQAHEQLAAMDTIFLKETTFPMTEAGQKIDRDLAAKQDKLTPQMFAELWTQARNLNLIS